MSKLVYIEYPSPLKKVSCVNVETNEVVEVTSIARGVCKDISCIPDKKGVYRMELEFEYDPSSLRSVNTFKISGTEPTAADSDVSEETVSLNIPGLTSAKTNEDGTVTFEIQSQDGSTTEVNADIPGVKVLTKEDGSVSVSMPSPRPSRKVTKIKYHEEMPAFSSTSTTTTTTTSLPSSVVGSLSLPRQQNITAKLPCPKEHQDNVRAECTGPDGSQVEVESSPVDDKTIKLVFSPSLGNGVYSLNYYIADKIFPGCPIQMDIKGI